MQYAESIDDFARMMKEGNNGGYANTWLVADRKTNEIARLELGLKNVTLERSKDGYFVGANFPINEKLITEETDYQPGPEVPDQVRHIRWDQLMLEYKGKIDVATAEKFETDHYDALTKEIDPNERTICGHVDKSGRGMKGWQEPYGPAGVAQAKVGDGAMAERMSFIAGMGHPCGVEFHAADHLKKHPEFAWQSPLLRDIKANPVDGGRCRAGGHRRTGYTVRDKRMDEPSRAHLLAELEVSEAEFLGVLAGVSEEEARFRVGEESWTILDCVEHTAACGSGDVQSRSVRATRCSLNL